MAMGHSHASKVVEVSSRMGQDMGLMYVRTVVGPRVLYDMELTGGQFQGERLRKVWEKLLSKATLVADDDERGSFVSRRDAFTKKPGLMSETVEIPWDIQVQGRAASLYKRIRGQRVTMAGAAYAKGEADGSVRQMKVPRRVVAIEIGLDTSQISRKTTFLSISETRFVPLLAISIALVMSELESEHTRKS